MRLFNSKLVRGSQWFVLCFVLFVTGLAVTRYVGDSAQLVRSLQTNDLSEQPVIDSPVLAVSSVEALNSPLLSGAASESTTATLTDLPSMPAAAISAPNEYAEHTLFAIIGDYGLDSTDVRIVSDLVKSWNPEYITTVGDNNYPDGSMDTMDGNVGKFYQQFLHNYQGKYGAGSLEQRFFPSLGNHDWDSIFCIESVCDGPYFQYFSIDLDKRYYTFRKGPVRFFMMDSDSKEPDGISGISNQALWLKEQLASSEAPWNLVLMHHPPYSSGGHRSHEQLQWPYKAWGADAVISGHNHLYERIERDDMVFFVNGLGGKSKHPFRQEQPSWVKARQNEKNGAMRVHANSEYITFEFHDTSYRIHDRLTLHATQEPDDQLQSASAMYETSVPIGHASGDVTQNLATGTVEPIGYVLELGQQRNEQPTMVGLRFTNVEIPRNAVITKATIEFASQRDGQSESSLIISGEHGCNAKPFTAQPNSLTARPKTTATVGWQNQDNWGIVGEPNQTADISSIVQEIIGHGGWQRGNAMAFFIHGEGKRYGVSHELQPGMAPRLNVTYEISVAANNTSTNTGSRNQFSNNIFIPTLINQTCPTS